MAHTTSIYYRDRLGFEPDYEPHRRHHHPQPASGGDGVKGSPGAAAGGSGGMKGGSGSYNGRSSAINDDFMTGGVYEENLNKFKGRGRQREQFWGSHANVIISSSNSNSSSHGQKYPTVLTVETFKRNNRFILCHLGETEKVNRI